MHLHFLVCGCAAGGHFLGLGGVEGGLKLVVRQLVENLEAVLEGSY